LILFRTKAWLFVLSVITFGLLLLNNSLRMSWYCEKLRFSQSFAFAK